jgi:hypothetical protein
MRLDDDHTAEKKQVKQFNETLNQANADDDDASSPKTTPQPKAIGGLPTTQSLDTGPKFTDEQIYAETDAVSKRIDEQIAEDRGIAKKPYQERLQHARERVSANMDTWGTPKYNATKMTGDMVWNYGRNNTWKDGQGREHPFFTESERRAVYEDQKSKQQLDQREQKEASERELARVQIEHARQWENQGDQHSSPAMVLQPFAFGALGAPVYWAYAGIQTGKAIGDAYNACQSGPTAECLAEAAHAGIAVATDVYTAKSSVQSKGPQVGPPSSLNPASDLKTIPREHLDAVMGGSRRPSGEFFDLDEAATHALGEEATVPDPTPVETIGVVKKEGVIQELKALGYDPNDFRAVQYRTMSKQGDIIITVFENDQGVYFGPHISSQYKP